MVMVAVVMMVTMVSIILGGGKRSGESPKEGIWWALVKKLNEGQRAHMVERGERALCERGEAFRKLCLPLIDPSLLLKGGYSKLPPSPLLLGCSYLLCCCCVLFSRLAVSDSV